MQRPYISGGLIRYCVVACTSAAQGGARPVAEDHVVVKWQA